MTRDVLVSISGFHTDEPIEILSPGTYFFKDGTHYIFFEEMEEGLSEVTKTQIRLKGTESLEVTKKGNLNTHMVFERNKNNRCYYKTPYGQLNLGICTGEIAVNVSEDNIDIRVEYALDINYEPLADCTIRIQIKAKKTGY